MAHRGLGRRCAEHLLAEIFAEIFAEIGTNIMNEIAKAPRGLPGAGSSVRRGLAGRRGGKPGRDAARRDACRSDNNSRRDTCHVAVRYAGHPRLGWEDTLCYLTIPAILICTQTLSLYLLGRRVTLPPRRVRCSA